jgi:hypothetical protein
LAAIVSAGVVLKMYWHQLLAVVRKLVKRNDSSNEDRSSSGSGR